MKNLGGVTQEHSFMVYDSGANQVGKYLDGTPVEMSFWGNDTVMAYSDYCKMRKQLGYGKNRFGKKDTLLCRESAV